MENTQSLISPDDFIAQITDLRADPSPETLIGKLVVS